MYIIGLLVLAGYFLTVNTDEILNELVCENEEMEFTCPKGYTIEILSAMYGRKDRRICSDPKKNDTDCEAYGSNVKISDRCNLRQQCRILADSTLFGNPCVGYRKYLQVSYRCLRNHDILSRITCEYEQFKVKCPPDHFIKIVNALYGKKNPLTCYRKTNRQYTNKCGDSLTATDILASRCDNSNNCSVMAENKVFGDPCVFTYKYLEVDYLCLNDITKPSTAPETKRKGLDLEDFHIHLPELRTPINHRLLENMPDVSHLVVGSMPEINKKKPNRSAKSSILGDTM
uniref:Putative galactoside-binding lectin n=1 Tax=Panstrongylus lignarius TaxID=156445 RepID=A0A224XH89_9HEMI